MGLFGPSKNEKLLQEANARLVQENTRLSELLLPEHKEIDALNSKINNLKETLFSLDRNINENKNIIDTLNKTISELTGFNQEVVTNGNGEYSFNSIPAGNYVVRFIYGDNDVAMLTGNTGNQEVYNEKSKGYIARICPCCFTSTLHLNNVR